ncbi:ArnT family glycosyltransferase [Leptothermofonsia sp. ETS-13]|uniref:ArnT family glycosyltransferase n=1 Tax=Leptothermofonsia sp. ETS-13 TaxID=3035696 RepID=UPI003BA3D78E
MKVERQIVDFWRYLNKNPVSARLIAIAWILVIGGIAFIGNLGGTGLVDETEPLFAEAARQMKETGDWVTPYFNGAPRFDKPPLIYWLMAIAYQMIGVNEWAARLPSALSAIALMGMGFYTLKRFGAATLDGYPDSNQCWLSAFIGSALIALHPLTIIWARTGVSDMLLTGCIGLALMAFFCGYAEGEVDQGKSLQIHNLVFKTSQIWYFTFYLLIALAILTKGPVGIVLPGLTIGSFVLYVGNWRAVLREMHLLQGLFIILLVALPWHILVTLANGKAFIDSFFGYHNVERFTEVVNRHWAPWYFYFVVVLLGFVPWSLYLPAAIARLRFWKRSIWRHQPRTTHLGLFTFFWFVCIFGFFTIAATKLPSYVLPLMPAAGILVALLWAEQMGRSSSPSWMMKLGNVLNGVFFLILGGVLVYTPQLVKGDQAMPDLAPLLQESGLPILGGAIAIATAMAIGLLALRRQGQWVWLVNLLGMLTLIIFVLLPAASIVDSQRQLPLRQLAQVIVQERQPGEELVMIGTTKPSIVFYTRQPVTFKLRARSAAIYLQKRTISQPGISTVLILTTPKKLEVLDLQPAQYQNLGKSGPYQLIRVSEQVLSRLPQE